MLPRSGRSGMAGSGRHFRRRDFPTCGKGRQGPRSATDGTERLRFGESLRGPVGTYRLGFKGADFGAHSLRAGSLTSAARRGASVFKMRDISRHKSMDVLQSCVRDADLFRDHAGAQLLYRVYQGPIDDFY
jgi:hypothetical protein